MNYYTNTNDSNFEEFYQASESEQIRWEIKELLKERPATKKERQEHRAKLEQLEADLRKAREIEDNIPKPSKPKKGIIQ